MLDRRADGKLLAHHRGWLVPGLGCAALRRLRISYQVGPRPATELHGVGGRYRCLRCDVRRTRENLEPGQCEAEVGFAPTGQPGDRKADVTRAHRREAIALYLSFGAGQVHIGPVDDGRRVGEVGPPRHLDSEPHREQVSRPFRFPDAGIARCAGLRDPRSSRMESHGVDLEFVTEIHRHRLRDVRSRGESGQEPVAGSGRCWL